MTIFIIYENTTIFKIFPAWREKTAKKLVEQLNAGNPIYTLEQRLFDKE